MFLILIIQLSTQDYLTEKHYFGFSFGSLKPEKYFISLTNLNLFLSISTGKKKTKLRLGTKTVFILTITETKYLVICLFHYFVSPALITSYL